MKWGKTIIVIVCAVLITALGIDAADTIKGSDGTLLSQVINSKGNGSCPTGMSEIDNGVTLRCADQFEVSPSKECPVGEPQSSIESHKNVESGLCNGESKANANPWRFITRDQAMQLCAREGKRLPTTAEWHTLSLGMRDVENSCNVNPKKISLTGSFLECKSPNEVFDLVGNVWEWVHDDIVDGKYNERQLPENGFVAQVDNSGMAVTTKNEEDELFGKDYFWSPDMGVFGIVRGGYYDSGTDAGIYSIHADTPPNAASIGIGFRCVL